jgi:hypothetical protein
VKSNSIDAQDSMISWMRMVGRRVDRLERKGRLDLLNEPEVADTGLSAVPTLGDIPPDIPQGQRVYVQDTGEVLVQDPVTLAWVPLP